MTDTEIKAVEAAPKPVKAEPYWFARRFPTNEERDGMGPVHWKGWAAFVLFAGATMFGALVFLFMVIAGSILSGVIAFAAIGGGALFALMAVVARKGDKTKTMEDYAKARGHAVG